LIGFEAITTKMTMTNTNQINTDLMNLQLAIPEISPYMGECIRESTEYVYGATPVYKPGHRISHLSFPKDKLPDLPMVAHPNLDFKVKFATQVESYIKAKQWKALSRLQEKLIEEKESTQYELDRLNEAHRLIEQLSAVLEVIEEDIRPDSSRVRYSNTTNAYENLGKLGKYLRPKHKSSFEGVNTLKGALSVADWKSEYLFHFIMKHNVNRRTIKNIVKEKAYCAICCDTCVCETLSCGHKFCRDTLIQLPTTNNWSYEDDCINCPMCRAKIDRNEFV
tara:strand:+ start:5997 stop:6833 length:837 start_codon:yes stop_codon:yes gene_type:complete